MLGTNGQGLTLHCGTARNTMRLQNGTEIAQGFYMKQMRL